jgi:hypothetical protein
MEPMWLWSSAPQAGPAHVTVLWQAYLRRFDIEHTFRFLKQVLGWTAPRVRDPAAADRWTWLILACYALSCPAFSGQGIAVNSCGYIHSHQLVHDLSRGPVAER